MPRLLSLACFLLIVPLAQGADLFDDGRWNGPIVLPASPEPHEWHAAQTLADWCERVTSQRPEIVQEKVGEVSPSFGIFVGQTRVTSEYGLAAPAAEGDTALRKTNRHGVFLLGNHPAATRIAVGRFCEQALGITFVAPGVRGADWQKLGRVGVPADDIFSPAYSWRALGGLQGEGKEWAYAVGFGEVPAFSHAMHQVFKLPSAMGPTPRLDTPEAPEQGARHTRQYFHDHPDAFSAPLGINDSPAFAPGVISEGTYRQRPVYTDHLVGFLNQVAASFWEPTGDLAGERHAIGTLAYGPTLRAPTLRVHPAIFPWVCVDRLGYADSAFAQQDITNVRAWAKSGARRVGVYDYIYGAEMAAPRVAFAPLAASIRATHTAGARGWYAELYPLWAFDAPKAWLAAKLLDDPFLPTEPLLAHWFAAAYGPAAQPMRRVYAVIEGAWQRDARAGGLDQWIRHYHDESAAGVLAVGETLEVEQCLVEARQACIRQQPAPRLAAQVARLEKFTQAWALAQSYRRLTSQRAVASGQNPLALLRELGGAEGDYLAREQEFNQAQPAQGTTVRWSSFKAHNPRPRLLREALRDGVPAKALAAAIQPGGDQAMLDLLVAQFEVGPELLEPFLTRHRGLRAELSANAGDILHLRWAVPPATVEGATLTLRFIAAGQIRTLAVRAGALTAEITTVVPRGTERIESVVDLAGTAGNPEVTSVVLRPDQLVR